MSDFQSLLTGLTALGQGDAAARNAARQAKRAFSIGDLNTLAADPAEQFFRDRLQAQQSALPTGLPAIVQAPDFVQDGVGTSPQDVGIVRTNGIGLRTTRRSVASSLGVRQ